MLAPRRPVACAPPPRPCERADVVTCTARRARVTLGACLDGYLDANAMGLSARRCYRCPAGVVRRAAYAEGRPLE